MDISISALSFWIVSIDKEVSIGEEIFHLVALGYKRRIRYLQSKETKIEKETEKKKKNKQLKKSLKTCGLVNAGEAYVWFPSVYKHCRSSANCDEVSITVFRCFFQFSMWGPVVVHSAALQVFFWQVVNVEYVHQWRWRRFHGKLWSAFLHYSLEDESLQCWCIRCQILTKFICSIVLFVSVCPGKRLMYHCSMVDLVCSKSRASRTDGMQSDSRHALDCRRCHTRLALVQVLDMI